jgi:hypothetical protein
MNQNTWLKADSLNLLRNLRQSPRLHEMLQNSGCFLIRRSRSFDPKSGLGWNRPFSKTENHAKIYHPKMPNECKLVPKLRDSEQIRKAANDVIFWVEFPTATQSLGSLNGLPPESAHERNSGQRKVLTLAIARL